MRLGLLQLFILTALDPDVPHVPLPPPRDDEDEATPVDDEGESDVVD